MKSLQTLPFFLLPFLLLPLLLLSFPTPSHQLSIFANPRLETAFIALQAWKSAITSDPYNFTNNWHGPNVCTYTGVFCTTALDNTNISTVAGIDLNHANIAGTLPNELGLLTDLALFHLNSNRFWGPIPHTLKYWRLLYELDLSNNRFYGWFPSVVLSLPSLKFLDLRYNYFEGPVPSKLFDIKLDAIFINNNNFTSKFPTNIANSPVSVAVLAHNNLHGCIPLNISKMATTLDEIILIDVGLRACLPRQIGRLNQLTVLDVSVNSLTGPLPASMGNMKRLEQLNVANNLLTGDIPVAICELPVLENFTFSFNLFTGVPPQCLALKHIDDTFNRIPNRPAQRPLQLCNDLTAYPAVSCRRSSLTC